MIPTDTLAITSTAARLEFWANSLGIVGFGLTIVGFAVTLRQVRRAKDAATQAAEAATTARDTLIRYDALADFSAALTGMAEIQRLHRAGAWEAVQDRYSDSRHKLIAVRAALAPLTEEHAASLQSAIQQLLSIEKTVSRLRSENRLPEVAKLNALLSREVDSLVVLMTQLRLNSENVK